MAGWSWSFLVVVLLVAAAACLGSKTGVWIPDDVPTPDTARDGADADADVRADDGGAPDDSAADEAAGLDDSAPDDARPDEAGWDEGGRDDGGGCPGGCDDRIDCTNDRCEPGTGCLHEPVDARCGSFSECTRGVCDPVVGCYEVPAPELCDDGLACTHDACDGPAGSCTHRPDDALCEDHAACTSESCDPVLGCVYVPDDSDCPEGEHCDTDCHGCAPELARPGTFLAFSLRTLYRVDPAVPSIEPVRRMGFDYEDIAVTSDGRMWGASLFSLYRVEPCRLTGSSVHGFLATYVDGLAAGPDGEWYYAGYGPYGLHRIDPGSYAERVAVPWFFGTVDLPTDVVYGPDDTLYVSVVTASGTDTVLYRAAPATGEVVQLATISGWAVTGLAFVAGTLYGVTATGEVLELDPERGVVFIPLAVADSFRGAASAPRDISGS